MIYLKSPSSKKIKSKNLKILASSNEATNRIFNYNYFFTHGDCK